jgi:peptidoglycan/LPS O-acetylase OafA/YrhL
MAQLGEFGPSGIGITWSLAIEEQFYLSIPLLIRKVRMRYLAAALLAVIVGAPLFRFLLHATATHAGMASYVLMPARADALCLGVLIALLVRNDTFWSRLQANRPMLWSVTAVLFAGAVFMTWRSYDALSIPMTTWGFSWLAALYTCILLIAIAPSGIVPAILRNQSLIRLGTLAYCSYLIHVGVMQAVRQPLKAHFPQFPVAAWIFGGLVGMAITLLAASLSFEYFEKPLLRRRRQYSY